MRCLVIFFSQSGNTERIARAITEGVEEAAGHCDIIPLRDANPRRLHEYDLLGVGAPVWGIEPPNVTRFLKNMRFVGGKHAFAFCTHGGVGDPFFPSVIPGLKERGLVVIGARDWPGDCTLYHHCQPYPTARHPDEIDLEEARDFGIAMVERSRRVSAGEADIVLPTPLPPRPLAETESSGYALVKTFPAKIKFHREKCTYPRCRLCMDNCPVDGIDLSMSPVVMAKPCAACEFCARICPTGAIDISEWLESMRAGGPEMMRKVILPSLARAEAEGTFRRLLPLDQVGFTLNYQIHAGHPQWIIGKGYGDKVDSDKRSGGS
jgi:flavodoxin/ferredoxin